MDSRGRRDNVKVDTGTRGMPLAFEDNIRRGVRSRGRYCSSTRIVGCNPRTGKRGAKKDDEESERDLCNACVLRSVI